MKNKPLIGILGGMGTAAGLHFQNLLFQECTKQGIIGDQDYPEWIYFNASKAPDRTAALNKLASSPTEYLVSSVKRMEAAGADLIVVICNTAHAFHKQILQETNIPWIDLQKETASYIKRKGYRSAVLFSTEGTLKSGLFKEAIEPLGIEYMEPNPGSEIQQKITKSIYNEHFGIKYTGSCISEKAKELLQSVINNYKSEVIIAGCTELSFAFPELNLTRDWIDPLILAAQKCFEYCCKS